MKTQNSNPLVSVIIPTTGNSLLQEAIESVQFQQYQNVQCLVFIDGKERENSARQILDRITLRKETHILTLPYVTGKNRYQGHRIYGAACFLAAGEFLVFLDEDNWLDADHILSLVKLSTTYQLDWAYSLRKIVNQASEFLINDNFLSLGEWTCIFKKSGYDHHIDTGCFFLRRSVAASCSFIWNRQSPPEKDPDTVLANHLLKEFPNYKCSGNYSLNYRADSTQHSAPAGLFFYGNALMERKYPDRYPWVNTVNNSCINHKLRSQNSVILPKQLKHFIILGYSSIEASQLTKFIDLHKTIHCAGEIFHQNSQHPDVVAARNLLSLENKPLTILDLPNFLNLCNTQTQSTAVGFTLLSPHIHSLKMKTIFALIDSGLKIIYLQHHDLKQAMQSVFSQIKLDLDSLNIKQKEDCTNSFKRYFVEIEKRLDNKNPLLRLQVDSIFNSNWELLEATKHEILAFVK